MDPRGGVTMQSPTTPWVTKNPAPSGRTSGPDAPRVEVVDEPLCSASEVRRAVLAGAITSGLFGAIIGMAFGYVLGLRDGKEE